MMKRCLEDSPLLLSVLLILTQTAYSAEKVEQQEKSDSRSQQFSYDREEFAKQWKEVRKRYPLVARAYLHLEAAVYQNVISNLPPGVVFQPPESTDADTGAGLSYSPSICNLPPGVAISVDKTSSICKVQCDQLADKHCPDPYDCYGLEDELRDRCLNGVDQCLAGFESCRDGCDEMASRGCPW